MDQLKVTVRDAVHTVTLTNYCDFMVSVLDGSKLFVNHEKTVE
jgi:hypothetical protein